MSHLRSSNEWIKALGLNRWGITEASEIVYNPSYEQLFEEEISYQGDDCGKGVMTNLGAVNVDTGRFTGRSPKDKYFVVESESKEKVWWAGTGSDNHPISESVWSELKKISLTQLNGKRLFVVDSYCGANPHTRLSVRLITEVAWKAHFAKNMFIRPTDEELMSFQPDWTILDSCKTAVQDFKRLGLRSEVFVAAKIEERATLIGGTWYGGEIKKGIFSVMNYFLPLKGIGSFHCSANQGSKGDTALFFGLSGTGKTTLSTDPKRLLIGDDEHGWDDEGVFNFEGGCYAKCIHLSKESEPDIYAALKRNALLENIAFDQDGNVDFSDDTKTENTRASYPIEHISNIVRPVSKGTHPKNIVFLTCDAFGVLPPVARLDANHAEYQYLSGYTAKVAGTEIGIVEPRATFSPCFGGPFLTLHPTVYGDILREKMEVHGTRAYLVNTGWSGGPYGVGKRMSISTTRAIIDAIFDGRLERAQWTFFPVFDFEIPLSVEGISSELLNPRNTWNDQRAYDKSLNHLGQLFVENFKKFTDVSAGRRLAHVGPKMDHGFDSGMRETSFR